MSNTSPPSSSQGIPGSSTPKFPILKLRDFANLQPTEWLVKGVIPKGATVMIFGQPGDYKTFVAISLAAAIATGKPWCGFATSPGESLYVAGEGLLDVVRRARAWTNLHAPGADPNLSFTWEPIQFLKPKHVTLALAEIHAQSHKPTLVVIDTLARAAVGGDENSAKDMGEFIDQIERFKRATGATILIIHHTTKNGRGERGSSVVRGAIDGLIECDKSGDKRLTLICQKMRLDRAFADINLKLCEVSTGIGSDITLAVEGPCMALDVQTFADAQKDVLRVLADQFPNGATFTEWLTASKKKRTHFSNIVGALKMMGRVSGGGSKGSKYHVVTPNGAVATNGQGASLNVSPAIGPSVQISPN
jgi:hypothetical protein